MKSIKVESKEPKLRANEIKRNGAGGHRDKKYDLKGRKACRKADPRKVDRSYA